MDPEQEKASRSNAKFSTLKNLAKVSRIFGTVLSVFAVVTFIIGLILVVLQLGFEADYTSSVFLKCLWILLALLFRFLPDTIRTCSLFYGDRREHTSIHSFVRTINLRKINRGQLIQ